MITGYSAVVDPAAVGTPLTAFISVTPLDPREPDDIPDRLRDIHQIVSCWSVAAWAAASEDEKIAALRSNPASRNLKAVRENRFVNLPYAMWVSSPLNIDAAEIMRGVLENHGLAPESGITPSLDVAQLDLGGNNWLE